MQDKINNLTTDEIQSLVEICVALVHALPDQNPSGMPDLMLGRDKALEVLSWLKSKDFIK